MPARKKPRTDKEKAKIAKSMAGNDNAADNDGGRPTKYKKVFADQVYKLCLLGATDIEIAGFFEISVSTLNRWKEKHTEFWESIRAGKELSDMEVAKSLRNRAVGMTVKVQKAIKIKTGQSQEKIEIVEVEEFIPPDQKSIEFWLKNRRSEKWRERRSVEHTGEGGGPIQATVDFDASKLSDEELFMLIKLRKKAKPNDG